MDLEAAAERASHVRALYAQLETKKYGRSWTATKLMLGFVRDVGELARLVAASEGIRDFEGDLHEAIEHELADCLWSTLVLANELNVDLASAFEKTMNQLEHKLKAAADR